MSARGLAARRFDVAARRHRARCTVLGVLVALALVPAAAGAQTPVYGHAAPGTALRASASDRAATAFVSDGSAGEIVGARVVGDVAWTQLRTEAGVG